MEISDVFLTVIWWTARVRPILGRKACLGMKIIKYLDNDQLNRPQTSDGGDVFMPMMRHWSLFYPLTSWSRNSIAFLVMELANFLENIT